MIELDEKYTFNDLYRNPTLEKIVPPLSTEKYQQLKESIAIKGVQVPLAIANIDGKDTIVDGYNRHDIVGNLIKQGLSTIVKAGYVIPVTMLPFHQLQDALEYSIEINLKRRQLTDYQTITWALEVYTEKTHKEIADKLGFKDVNKVNKVSQLNDKIEAINKMAICPLPKDMSDLIKGLQNGTEEEYFKALTLVRPYLSSAEQIQTAIDVVDDEQLRARLTREHEEDKYTKDPKKILESVALAEQIALHPELANEENIQADERYKVYQSIVDKIQKYRDKYGDNYVFSTRVVTEADAKNALNFCRVHAAKLDRPIYYIALFDIPVVS